MFFTYQVKVVSVKMKNGVVFVSIFQYISNFVIKKCQRVNFSSAFSLA